MQIIDIAIKIFVTEEFIIILVEMDIFYNIK